MSRPPQALRKNVPAATSHQRHRRQEQNLVPGRMQQMQPMQQQIQLQQHLPVDDYYYEEMQQEQFCCGDYEHESPVDMEECCSAPLTTSQQIDAARRGDVTELYRRRCPAAEAYPYQPHYHDELVMPSSQQTLRMQMPPIHNAPNVLRKRVLPVSANVSYHQFAMPTPPPTLPPTQVLQARASQTQYFPNDETIVLKQQAPTQQYEQLLQARNHQMQLQRQQQLHMQRQRQFQEYLQRQSQYNLPNQSNQTNQNLHHKHHVHVPQDSKLFRLHNGGYGEFSVGNNVETCNTIAPVNRVIATNSGPIAVLDPRTEKKVQTSARLCSDIKYQDSLEERKIMLDGSGNKSRTTIANDNEISVRESDSKRKHNASKSVTQGIVQTRRHPVTVRTPRYIRRAITPSLYKRPSALCIPLAVQPDPALFVTPSNNRKLKRDAQVQNNQKLNSQSQGSSPRKIPVKNLSLDVSQSSSNSPRSKRQEMIRVYDNSHETGVITRPLSKVDAQQVNESTREGGQTEHGLNDMGLPKSTQDRLDSIFQRYDNLFRDMVPSVDGKYTFSEKADNALENIDKLDKFENLEKMSKLEKYDSELMSRSNELVDVYNFKPRAPPCMKNKPTEAVKDKLPDAIEADTLQVEEMTTDMLDELLKELTKQGLNEIASAEEKQNQVVNEKRERLNAINKIEEEKYGQYLDGKKRNYDKFRVEKEKKQEREKNIKECPVKDLPKSFTYSEIKQSMSRSNDEFPEGHHILQNLSQTSKALDPVAVEQDELESEREQHRECERNGERDREQAIIFRNREREREREMDQEMKQERDFKREKEHERHNAHKQESDGDISSKKSISSTTTTSAARSGAKIIPRILVDDAMELHRTKSYVVNLIDTALSKHFNTVKDSKHKHKEKVHNKSTVQMLKKQNSTTSRSSSKSSQKDLVDEIAHVLDTFGCNSRHSNVTKDFSQCSCKSSREEPMFVRQLRQMRWGHLKHIQQEVRRLEELERFLDSCNLSTFEKCHYH